MQSRSPGCFGASPLAFVLSLLVLLASARTQELLPRELEAEALHAAGDRLGAAAALLALAGEQAADANIDAVRAARIESWATAAAMMLEGAADPELLQRFVALRGSPLATAMPLLADRLGMTERIAASGHVHLATSPLASELGVLRDFWLLGPFANERGAGYRNALPPEQAIDLDGVSPGMRRPVRWRRLPTLGGGWDVPLDHVLQPSEQALAYLATSLHVQAATDVALELGSTGSVRVFCNGAEVLARDVERPFAWDQDAVVLPLRAGPNLLLIKACHQEGASFRFAARVRGLQGGPTGVTASAERADLQAAIAATAAAVAPPAERPTPPLGGRSHWSIGGVRGADALRLCWLWCVRSADGDRDRRDAAAAAAAVQELPDHATAHLLLARTQERHGRSAADRDDNDRRRSLERTLALRPEHVAANTRLGDLLLQGSRLWRTARGHADRALAVAPDHPGALLLRAHTLEAEDLRPLAEVELLTAAARPTAHPDTLRTAANLLDAREPRRALALRQQVLRHSSDSDDARATARLLARTGDADAAIALLSRVLIADPLAAAARDDLVGLQLARGDVRAAITTLEAWLQIHPDDTAALVRAGACWRLLATPRPGAAANDAAAADPEALVRQLALLRDALQVEPNRRDDERYAEYLASSASGADEATAFHAPFQVDAAALLRADAGPPADAASANDPLHWLLRQQVVRANGNGTTNVYSHVIVRVLTPDGARSLVNFQLPHYGGEQRARLLACTVFRADGSVQRPALQGAGVRMPDLRPGDVVAIEGRVDDLAPSFFGDYFGLVHTFGSPEGSPVRADELVLLAAPGRDYRVQALHGAPVVEPTGLADGTRQYRWRMQELGRDAPEVRRPDRREYEPLVRITTYRDWDHFAAWWWNLIKTQLEVSEAMRATVARLCQGQPDTEAKIRAIYHFVTTDVRYEAWEFGVHGYKPYSTAIIHERRHGDCKDKALLLCALLGEIGVPCHPVLIFADPLRTQDDLTLPMVQHFNHCIAWLPPHEGKPGRFLDGTAVWHPSDTLPDMDQGAAVLVVDRGRAELLQVPWTTPDANVHAVEHTIELRADGSARLHTQQQPRGNSAVELRAMLATEPARRREVVERGLVRTFGKATLAELDAPAPASPEAPARLAAGADVAELGQRTAQSWQLPSVFDGSDLLALATDEHRQRPLLLGVPSGDVQTVRYRLPTGWRAGDLPAPVQQRTPFGSFSMRWTARGSEIEVVRELRLEAPRLEAADHAAFREFASAVKTADAQWVLLQKEAGR